MEFRKKSRVVAGLNFFFALNFSLFFFGISHCLSEFFICCQEKPRSRLLSRSSSKSAPTILACYSVLRRGNAADRLSLLFCHHRHRCHTLPQMDKEQRQYFPHSTFTSSEFGELSWAQYWAKSMEL